MSKGLTELRDLGSERALLGTIISHGKDSFSEASSILSASDFYLPINRSIYTAMESLVDDPNCYEFDIETLKMKIKALGMGDYISGKKELEYLNLLESTSLSEENIPMFAMQIKKYAVVRDLYKRYTDAISYIGSINGSESLSEIIREAEGKIVDFISGIEDQNSLVSLTENIDQYVEQILNEEIVDQVGIPTGFPLYDKAIGGGPRPGTISIIGSRSKVGKSYLGLVIGRNVSKIAVPTLILDTELTEQVVKERFICIDSGCPIELFETRKFKTNPELRSRVIESANKLKDTKLYYESIAGRSHTEALSIVKKWLVKHVGFDEFGKAKPCLIVYDYIKLMNADNITKNLAEYALLGFLITDMHNFAVKYGVPFVAFTQLNRDGIDGNDTGIVAGSDRLLWLCSSLSFLKNKDENDIDMCGWEYGNKKLYISETRFGSGLDENNYINIHASIRPNVRTNEACGMFKEGFLYSDVCKR